MTGGKWITTMENLACLALNYATSGLQPLNLVGNTDNMVTEITCAVWEFPLPHQRSKWTGHWLQASRLHCGMCCLGNGFSWQQASGF